MQEKQDSLLTEASGWDQWGSICLMGALSILWIKSAPDYWPFALLAVIGHLCVSLWRKKGLTIALLLLALAFCVTRCLYVEKGWLSLFLPAMGVSWFLIYAKKEQNERERTQTRAAFASVSSELTLCKQQLFNAQLNNQVLESQFNVQSKQQQSLLLQGEAALEEIKESRDHLGTVANR